MEDIDYKFIDTMLERPIGLTVGSRHFYIYQPTLGKSLLIGNLLKSIEINTPLMQFNSMAELLRLCSLHTDVCCRIIALSMCKGKEALDNEHVEEIITYLKDNAEPENLATLLAIVMKGDNIDEILNHYGISDELKEMSKAQRAKKDKGCPTFCGLTTYGKIIDPLADKYGWTLDYILWGISYNNIQLLLADAPKTLYLSDEELKKSGIHKGQEVLSMDDPETWEKIKKMDWR